MDNELFPNIKKSISDFIADEEASIPRGKLLAIGSVVVLLSVILSVEASAKHSSHKSHSSHSSTSYHRSHSSHSSSQGTHSSHSSHSSNSTVHSNHSSHSSTAASTTTYPKPLASDIPAPSEVSQISGDILNDSSISQRIEAMANPAGINIGNDAIPALSVPMDTPPMPTNSQIMQTPVNPPIVKKS